MLSGSLWERYRDEISSAIVVLLYNSAVVVSTTSRNQSVLELNRIAGAVCGLPDVPVKSRELFDA